MNLLNIVLRKRKLDLFDQKINWKESSPVDYYDYYAIYNGWRIQVFRKHLSPQISITPVEKNYWIDSDFIKNITLAIKLYEYIKLQNHDGEGNR